MEAYVAGLEKAHSQRPRPVDASTRSPRSSSPAWTPRSTSGWRTIGTDEALALRGKAGVANARLAYQRYEMFFAGERWEALAAAGAHTQRPLWASTGVKNPDYPDTHVRHRPGRPRHRQHDAGEDHGGLRRPRRGHRRPVTRRTTTRRRSWTQLAGSDRLRRRDRHPRAGGRREVRDVLGRAPGDRQGQLDGAGEGTSA